MVNLSGLIVKLSTPGALPFGILDIYQHFDFLAKDGFYTIGYHFFHS